MGHTSEESKLNWFRKTCAGIDWVLMQSLYDAGESIRLLADKTGVKRSTIGNAIALGLLTVRNGSEARLVAIAHGRHDPVEMWTPKVREKARTSRKRFLKDNPDQHPNRLLAGNRSFMTSPERLVNAFLIHTGIEFVYNAPVGRYFVDFLVGSTAIEIDDKRWHHRDNLRDVKRDAEIATFGIIVKRFDVKRVRSEGPQIVMEAISGDVGKR